MKLKNFGKIGAALIVVMTLAACEKEGSEFTNGSNVDGHQAVDLGLSVKWATVNLGANNPYDFGDYFAWGETKTKSNFTKNTNKWQDLKFADLESKGVINSKGVLTPEYDAATANWGQSWRMPTVEEYNELLNKCTWTWTSVSDHHGYKVTGPNGNSIFLPAAGYCINYDIKSPEESGYYWSSEVYEETIATTSLSFKTTTQKIINCYRYYGQSIRAVTK